MNIVCTMCILYCMIKNIYYAMCIHCTYNTYYYCVYIVHISVSGANNLRLEYINTRHKLMSFLRNALGICVVALNTFNCALGWCIGGCWCCRTNRCAGGAGCNFFVMILQRFNCLYLRCVDSESSDSLSLFFRFL